MLAGYPAPVVGVLPSDAFPRDTDVFAPADPSFQNTDRGGRYLGIAGRLAAAVTIEQAQDEIDQQIDALRNQFAELIHFQKKVFNQLLGLLRRDLVPVLEQLVPTQKPLLIIAETVENEALAGITINAMRSSARAGVSACNVEIEPGWPVLMASRKFSASTPRIFIMMITTGCCPNSN